MTQPQTIIIGITGKKGAGKDYAADVIANYCASNGISVYRTSFAEPLKIMLSAGLDLDTDSFVDRTKKESVIPHIGCTPRKLMQTLGTDWGRNIIADNIWINLCQRRLIKAKNNGCNVLLVTDVRYDNEAQMVKDLGGIILEVRCYQQYMQELEKSAIKQWFLRTFTKKEHASEKGISPSLVKCSLVNNKTPGFNFLLLDYISYYFQKMGYAHDRKSKEMG